MTRATRIAAFAAVLAACAHTQGGAAPDDPPPPSARLTVPCPIGEATLRIDDRYVGELRELSGGVRLPVGRHRLELRADGYVTRYLELTIEDGKDQRVECHLREELPAP